MKQRCPTSGKVAFVTLDQARKEARKMTFKNKCRGEPAQVDVYICPNCRTYHIGRGPKAGKPDLALQRF
jgi:predicted RNA-binding Zn-ribbon protein involved in translation (DUF1610 family)